MTGRLLLLLSLVAAPIATATAQDAAAIVGRSSRVYRSLSSLKADFVQVVDNVTSVLTNRAVPTETLDPADAERRLTEANTIVPKSEAAFDAKEREQERSRRILALTRRSR